MPQQNSLIFYLTLWALLSLMASLLPTFTITLLLPLRFLVWTLMKGVTLWNWFSLILLRWVSSSNVAISWIHLLHYCSFQCTLIEHGKIKPKIMHFICNLPNNVIMEKFLVVLWFALTFTCVYFSLHFLKKLCLWLNKTPYMTNSQNGKKLYGIFDKLSRSEALGVTFVLYYLRTQLDFASFKLLKSHLAKDKPEWFYKHSWIFNRITCFSFHTYHTIFHFFVWLVLIFTYSIIENSFNLIYMNKIKLKRLNWTKESTVGPRLLYS